MNTSQSKLSPQEVFDNKKLFSNKIHVRFLKVIEEILTSLDKFEIVNHEDKKTFLNVINHYYNDLCASIFHLRQVLITVINDDEQRIRNVIIELNKIALSVQESLNLETDKLRVHLEGTLIHVGSQVENLTKILKCDNQECKQKLVDIQLDLLISAGALKFYIQHPNLSISEWERTAHEAIEKLRTILSQIKNGHELLEEDFVHYARLNLQNLQNKVDYLRKMRNTKNFPMDIAKAFENCEIIGNHFINELMESLLYDNPIKAMLDALDDCHKEITKAGIELQEVIQPVFKKSIEKNDNETAKQLVIYLMVCGLNGMYNFNKSIENAIMKK